MRISETMPHPISESIAIATSDSGSGMERPCTAALKMPWKGATMEANDQDDVDEPDDPPDDGNYGTGVVGIVNGRHRGPRNASAANR